jgi:hypothetical protein
LQAQSDVALSEKDSAIEALEAALSDAHAAADAVSAQVRTDLPRFCGTGT